MATNNKNVEHEKLVAGLSYVLVGIIWYFIDDKIKKSDFAKFHVKQGLNLLLISLILNMAIQALSFITFGLFNMITWVFGVIILILWIIGIINVINNEKKKVPVIGVFAEKYLKF